MVLKSELKQSQRSCLSVTRFGARRQIRKARRPVVILLATRLFLVQHPGYKKIPHLNQKRPKPFTFRSFETFWSLRGR